MKKVYRKNEIALRYSPPAVKIFAAGAIISLLFILLLIINYFIQSINSQIHLYFFILLENVVDKLIRISYILIPFIFSMSVILLFLASDETRICSVIKKYLFLSSNGNPMGFQEREVLPYVSVTKLKHGRYRITINAETVSVDKLVKLSANISSALTGKYKNFSVISIETDIAMNSVSYIVDDVLVDKTLTISNINDFRCSRTRISINSDTYINLKTSGSMIVAGKTRSGKSTGVIAILTQVLMQGRDKYGSEVIIIDPKKAELSTLSHTITLDDDGEAREILEVLRNYILTMRKRQRVLNKLSDKKGDVVKWWNAKMNPSFVFIDEYVALRSLLPKKTSKERPDPDYCLDEFDSLVKQIVTQGASAGCFMIISIAQASVNSGLPSVINEAMSTRILFRPTIEEGRFLWPSEMLSCMPQRTYKPGDAWFSSTDGKHDSVSFVHFPVMDYAVYAELDRLLREYYN